MPEPEPSEWRKNETIRKARIQKDLDDYVVEYEASLVADAEALAAEGVIKTEAERSNKEAWQTTLDEKRAARPAQIAAAQQARLAAREAAENAAREERDRGRP